MPYRDDDDDREKPSWREIDKRREKSSHRASSKSDRQDNAGELLRSEFRKKQYMKQADKIFGGKKAQPELEKAKKDLLDSAGKRTFQAKAAAFFAEHQDTEDWEVILALLEVTDPDLLEKVADHLVELFPQKSPAEQKTAVSTLRILAMTAKDINLIEIAKETLNRLD